MNYTIEFSPEASKIIAKWKKLNPIPFKKLSSFMTELVEHPRTGTGHPEPLTAGNDVTYSRRISANDRIIYDIYDEKVVVLILSVEGHYKDK
jgi:toxin YoeB